MPVAAQPVQLFTWDAATRPPRLQIAWRSPSPHGTFYTRHADVDDAEALSAAQHDAIHSLGGVYYPPALLSAWASGLTPDVYESAMEVGETFFVATAHPNDARLLGFSSHHLVRQSHVVSVSVTGRAVRRGIGSALLSMATRAAVRFGADDVTIHALVPEMPFYAAHGFRETGRTLVRLRSGHQMDCVQMRKLLRG